jgi:macrodomain Ter protein organizer (MatP/YcbG family)
VFLTLHSDGGGEQAICSVEKNQFSSSKDETTKQDIDLEIKYFLKTSHIL